MGDLLAKDIIVALDFPSSGEALSCLGAFDGDDGSVVLVPVRKTQLLRARGGGELAEGGVGIDADVVGAGRNVPPAVRAANARRHHLLVDEAA